MAGLGKKPAMMAADSFTALFDKVSKATLIDALWCACQLGTNETTPEITSQAARNVAIAMENRGDRVIRAIREAAAIHIDSDGDYAPMTTSRKGEV